MTWSTERVKYMLPCSRTRLRISPREAGSAFPSRVIPLIRIAVHYSYENSPTNVELPTGITTTVPQQCLLKRTDDKNNSSGSTTAGLLYTVLISALPLTFDSKCKMLVRRRSLTAPHRHRAIKLYCTAVLNCSALLPFLKKMCRRQEDAFGS